MINAVLLQIYHLFHSEQNMTLRSDKKDSIETIFQVEQIFIPRLEEEVCLYTSITILHPQANKWSL